MEFETRIGVSKKVVLYNIVDPEETIVIPDTISLIKEGTFKNCSITKKVIIPSSVEELYPAFEGCTNLETIILSEGVKSLNRHTFKYCKSLRHVELPESLEGRIDNAFAHCVSLEKIRIPSKVNHIGSDYYKDLSGFTGCISLREVILEEGLRWIDAETFFGCESLEEIILPETMFYIGPRAFSGCTKLSRVTIKGKIHQFSASAFQKCPALREVYVAKSQLDEAKKIFKDKVTYYTPDGKPLLTLQKQETRKKEARKAVNAFQVSQDEAGLLSSVDRTSSTIEIPAGITVIPADAFSGLETLETLILGPDIVSIEAGAFSGCRNILGIALNRNIKNIAKNAFSKGPTWVRTITGTKAAIENVENALKGNFYAVPEPKKGEEKDLFDRISNIISPERLLLRSRGLSPKAKYKATGKPAAGLLLNYIAYAYASQLDNQEFNCKDCKKTYFKLQKDELADEISELLDHDTLLGGLEKWIPRVNVVIQKAYPGKEISILKADAVKKLIRSYCYNIDALCNHAEIFLDYTAELMAYCRYANEEQVQEIIKAFEIWENDEVFDLRTGNTKEKRMLQDVKNAGRECIIAARSALALNDSPTAKTYIKAFKCR